MNETITMSKSQLAKAFLRKYYHDAAFSVEEKCSGSCNHQKCSGSCNHHKCSGSCSSKCNSA